MPPQNPPKPQPAIPPAPAPVVPPPAEPRPNFVAFEETAPPNPGTAVSTPPPPPPPPSNIVVPSGKNTNKMLVVVGIIFIVILVGAGIFFVLQNRQVEPLPSSTPEAISPTAYCSNVRAYDIEGNSINNMALSNLQPGSIVRFAASGIASNGTFDKARFTINGVQRPEVTTKITGTDEFYDEFVIPEGITTFEVTAEVHLAETNTWH